MEQKLTKYEKYKSDIKFLLVASGVWPNYERHPRVLRKFLTISALFNSGFTLYAIIAFCVKYSSNIKLLTSCLGPLVGFVGVFIKVYILSSHEEDLHDLNRGVSARFEGNLKITEHQRHLLKHFSAFSKCFYMLKYSVGIGAAMLVCMPLLMLRHGKYARAYPQVLPFKYESGGFAHWAMFVFEVHGGFYLWSSTVGADSVFGLYALHIVGELELLSNRFRRLSSSPDYKKDLQSCIEDHYVLMRSRHKLQKIFSSLTIWLAISCAVSICGLVFQATQIKKSSYVKIFYLSCHVFLKFVQAYSYSWYGNIITVESSLCLNSVYEARWPGCGDERFMKDILIVIMQKPLVFRAKGFMDIRLDMFLKIVHTSVSYFFLLRTLDAKTS